jgi:hypothetical protein
LSEKPLQVPVVAAELQEKAFDLEVYLEIAGVPELVTIT